MKPGSRCPTRNWRPYGLREIRSMANGITPSVPDHNGSSNCCPVPKGNWEFLERHTDTQVVDFWHAAEYLGKAASVLYRGQPAARQSWTDASCHTPKHEPGGAATVLKQLKSLAKVRSWAKDDEDVQRAITYFTNQSGAGRMDYAARVAKKEPIGSGVTEAACKVIVKQRLCCSGMKWKESGAAAVLSLRCLNHTTGRGDQFWSKIDRWGFPVAA